MAGKETGVLEQILKNFLLTKKDLLKEAALFCADMSAARAGQQSGLAMLPSYLSLPCGSEQGEFLALDFGGSNIRIARVLLEKRTATIVRQEVRPLTFFVEAGATNSERLFDHIAVFINVFCGNKGGFLGHTFSYPVKQEGANCAKLKEWTKEAAFVGGESVDINQTLSLCLGKLGRADIKPVVLLNDTTAVLLDAVYRGNVRIGIGSICGTGHNSCYYDPGSGMVVNMESGNYRPFFRNIFDDRLDAASNHPGRQCLEKMTAGKYLAELAGLAAREAGLTGININTTEELAGYLGKKNKATPLVEAVLRRSARLLAAEYLGTANYLKQKGLVMDGIAIDGSVYNKMAFFQSELKKALAEIFECPPCLWPSEGASITGAAVAAAKFARQDWT